MSNGILSHTETLDPMLDWEQAMQGSGASWCCIVWQPLHFRLGETGKMLVVMTILTKQSNPIPLLLV